MYGAIGMSASSLHRESTDSLIIIHLHSICEKYNVMIMMILRLKVTETLTLLEDYGGLLLTRGLSPSVQLGLSQRPY